MDNTKHYFDNYYSNLLKGAALILMIIDHFCSFPNWIEDNNILIDISVLGNTLGYYIGAFGRICVGIFAFTSGYGFF